MLSSGAALPRNPRQRELRPRHFARGSIHRQTGLDGAAQTDTQEPRTDGPARTEGQARGDMSTAHEDVLCRDRCCVTSESEVTQVTSAAFRARQYSQTERPGRTSTDGYGRTEHGTHRRGRTRTDRAKTDQHGRTNTDGRTRTDKHGRTSTDGRARTGGTHGAT